MSTPPGKLTKSDTFGFQLQPRDSNPDAQVQSLLACQLAEAAMLLVPRVGFEPTPSGLKGQHPHH